MHRRDIFNILFKGNPHHEPVMVPDPVLATPDYLRTDQTIAIDKEWSDFFYGDRFLLDLSAQHLFMLTLDLTWPDTLSFTGQYNAMSLLMGIKTNTGENKRVRLGIKDGHLFIGNQADQRIILPEKLKQGIQLVLTVNPQADGRSYAKLKALDQSGLTLAVIRSEEFQVTDWAGEIEPGIYFHTLRIEGRKYI